MAADVEGFTLLALGIAFIIVRIYARWSIVGPSNFQVDDYLMPLAGVSYHNLFHHLEIESNRARRNALA